MHEFLINIPNWEYGIDEGITMIYFLSYILGVFSTLLYIRLKVHYMLWKWKQHPDYEMMAAYVRQKHNLDIKKILDNKRW